jgi:hypothetical protein
MVRPTNRNLSDTQSVLLREKQNLRIESESLRALLLKYDTSSLATKRFETALRVPETKTYDPTHKTIEEDARSFPKGRLMDLD